MDSAAGQLKFERLNNITTLDLNSLDEVSQQDYPLCFKRVVMSDVALLKMVKHTSLYNCKPAEQLRKEVRKDRNEFGGLFKGKVCGDAILVMDAFVLPLDHHLDFHVNLIDYFETQLQTGGLEDVVGWYRTSTIGGNPFPTETDLSTQMRIQKFRDPYFALVIDGGTTIDIVKVHVDAFWTYPEGYTPMNRKRDRPETIFQVFPHLEKRYPLQVTYFKSSLGSNDAWNVFWNHLISTPKKGGKTIGLEVSGNKENLDEKNKILCLVKVKSEYTKQYSSLTEAVDGLYRKLVKEVCGSSGSGSKIISIEKSAFFVPLTQEHSEKLTDHEFVEGIRVVPMGYIKILNNAKYYVK